MAVEEPPHAVLVRDGKFELRRYAPMVVAEVVTTGGRWPAVNAGFRPLARYIFGANTPGAKIAMTSPVTQTAGGGKGEKIAMTAPVVQAKQGDAWTIRFVMPAGSTLATMPAPVDPSVRLLEEPSRTVAALRGDNELWLGLAMMSGHLDELAFPPGYLIPRRKSSRSRAARLRTAHRGHHRFRTTLSELHRRGRPGMDRAPCQP